MKSRDNHVIVDRLNRSPCTVQPECAAVDARRDAARRNPRAGGGRTLVGTQGSRGWQDQLSSKGSRPTWRFPGPLAFAADRPFYVVDISKPGRADAVGMSQAGCAEQHDARAAGGA
jgi:hypothetical protein